MYNRRKHRAELRNLDKITEIKKFNLLNGFERKAMSVRHSRINSNTDEEYIMSNYFDKSYKINESAVNEDDMFVPNFKLKKYLDKIFTEFQPNKEMKYNRDLMIKAMEYGMIIQIQYRGAEDNFVQGRTRVVYPMCLGTSSKGKPLLRVYHIKGWSVSNRKNTEKIWRMFRTDRIASMSFTGMFFRLAPEGYNQADKGMRGGIIKSVDLKEVRNNQKRLIDQGSIQNKREVSLEEKTGKIPVIEVIDTNTSVNLMKPFDNPNIDKKNKGLLRLTFLRSVTGNNKILIMGALGKKGNTVKVSVKGKYLGLYKVIKYTKGDGLGKPHLKRVSGVSSYPLFLFMHKKN